MKQYLTNSFIKHKNEYINSLFFILNGTILETKTNRLYKDHSYLFLEFINKNEYAKSDYIAKTKVVGYWIDFNELDTSFLKIFSTIYFKQNIHNELLMLKDPIMKISRYLYYEYSTAKTPSFYILSIKELSDYLNIETKTVSQALNFLIDQSIISKHNKLINILKIKSLEDLSFF